MWDTLIIHPFTNTLMFIYSWLVDFPGAFGWSIIMFTILIKALTWPLNAQQLKGQKAMQEFQNDKDWKKIQKKYAKDKEKLAKEQMRLYKEKGVKPFASCLPTVVQMFVLFGLFQVFRNVLASEPLGLLNLAQDLYPSLNVNGIIPINSHFLWMDLSRPEGIPLPFEISFLPHGFPTLALIVGITTYLQSKLTMPVSSNPNDPSAAMTKQMTTIMPFFIGYITLTFPSGLAIYWVTSNLIGIFQYAVTGRANWRNLLPGGDKLATTR